MNVFYEEDGGFKAGNVLADQGASFQVESATGKRSKVKAANVLFDFREPDAATLMRDAQSLADAIDLDFLWECAPQAEFSFKDLASDYYGRAATPIESAALVTRLHSAPMYFYRKGRGHYRAAPPEALKAALAGIERKQREAALQVEYVAELVAGRLPDALRGRMRELIHQPDRNRLEYKAVVEASRARGTTPERLMLQVGGVPSAHALHRDRFLFEQFPRGIGFPDVAIPALPELPLAPVSAFSIDDSATTEIDDALSVTSREAGEDGMRGWRVGIHIAAPALAIRRGDPIDAIAHDRYSTVYSPGEKITMLPDAVVEAFTLEAGRDCAAVSLYVDVDEDASGAWTIVSSASRLERVPIGDNLRHDRLDDVVTEDALAADVGHYPRRAEIGVLWRFAKTLHARRQEARVAAGLRPESYHRPDYAFRVDRDAASGRETVAITERRRGSPLDTIVAELMILANATWGKLLADRRVPGIYRAQSGAFGPAGRVRMVTHPAPHVGLGVPQYAWSTSPLRRYVDLVNQWQIAACIRDEGASAPFAPRDAELFAIVSGFDATYAAYAEYQAKMERYWCLRWLAQEGVRVVDAHATGREDHAVLTSIPLVVRVAGLAELPRVARGQRIEAAIDETDEVDLTARAHLVALIEEVDELDALDESDDELAAAESIADGVAPPAPVEADPDAESAVPAAAVAATAAS